MKKETGKVSPWRQNIVVSYWFKCHVALHRHQFLSVITNLAELYKLDYAVHEEYPFFEDINRELEDSYKRTADLVYVRTNRHSLVSSLFFRRAVNGIFGTPGFQLCTGAQVGFQMREALKLYPFPSTFRRPLDYPFVEIHDGNETRRCVYHHEVMSILENSQQFPSN